MAGILVQNRSVSKMMIWNPRSEKFTYTNSTGGTVVIAKGRLLGRIGSSQKVLPQVSTATDGSQQPIAVAGDDYSVANGATVILTGFTGGDVAEEKLILAGSETLATLITGDTCSVRDALQRNTALKIVASTDLSGPYDNQ